MDFQSILFINKEDLPMNDPLTAPIYLSDLNLDQIIDAITASRKEYNLKPFYYKPLHTAESITYRHEVMRDMESAALMSSIKTFSEKMAVIRRYLEMISKLDFDYHRKGWMLDAALLYCQTVTELAHSLAQTELNSRGLLEFCLYVTDYLQSASFQALQADAQEVKKGLQEIKYSVIIQPGAFRVEKYEGETDYSIEVEQTFAKFKQGAVKDYRSQLYEKSGMNHIEAKILEFVARLHPAQFAALDSFCEQHPQFVDQAIRTFDREIQFYAAYLDFITEIKQKGLTFCYPSLSSTSREIFAYEAFDLALAHSVLYTEKPVVCNDFSLHESERIIVITGPNQGGKTTFARMFGQLHYLASLGCPVPGNQAQLFLFDQIFVHFERQEDIRNLRGKLQDDLVRIHEILDHASPDSILIVNEMFASTTLKDAVFLSKAIMEKITMLDLLCVWVTFMDELSSLNEKTISMVSTVVPDNPAVRTFKVVRRSADGLAYALSIAKKHRLTFEQIKERIHQ